jgi:hypothetical protein
MGGFAFRASYDDSTLNVEESLLEKSTNPCHTVDVPKYQTLIYIMKHFPHLITDTTEESILDRAESSSLSKALLVVQVGWFCTNCASRLFQRLPLSLLEISTTAHAFCTLVTYFVWWSKPINIAAPTLMREKEAREVHALLRCSDDGYDEALKLAQKKPAGDSLTPTGAHRLVHIDLVANALRHLPNPERPPRFSCVTNDHVLIPGSFASQPHDSIFYEAMTMAISPILYGLAHFLAWGDQFPTPLERLLWRISSCVVTCSGLMIVAATFLLILLAEIFHLSTPILKNLIQFICVVMLPFVHVLASGFLIVESFRQLFFLDPAAYQLPSWSNYWPHFS